MKPLFIKPLAFSIAATMALAITGCGGADTTINERDPIAAEDDHDHEGEHGGTALGRLLVINTTDTEADVFDLEDSDLITNVTLDALPSAVYATGGYRFAALIERNADTVGFVDGGLYQEPHDDHFDLFQIMPSLSSFSLSGSRPTHFVTHEGQSAVFLDGDSSTGNDAGVLVFDDHMVEEAEDPTSLAFSMPMHGVAEPRDDYLLTSVRRDDADSTSTNFILPDQVAVYHLHDGEYDLEETFTETCPDLHGAAQNETHIIFGCSDGVLIVTDNGSGSFSAQKLANSSDVADGLRIGSIWGHHESAQFIGKASAHGGSTVQLFTIDPAEVEMEEIDWQPMPDASPVTQGFAFEAEQFVILDDQGYLTVIEPHEEAGHTHWEYGDRFDFTTADVSTMPDGFKFSMALAQNAHTVYIADPIQQHILTVDLDVLGETGDIELDYPPSMITWLGIAEEHDH